MKNFEKFNLGNIKLLSGKSLKSAQLVYKTYGNLNKKKSNVIILPTFYTGTHVRNEGFIGKERRSFSVHKAEDFLAWVPKRMEGSCEGPGFR